MIDIFSILKQKLFPDNETSIIEKLKRKLIFLAILLGIIFFLSQIQKRIYRYSSTIQIINLYKITKKNFNILRKKRSLNNFLRKEKKYFINIYIADKLIIRDKISRTNFYLFLEDLIIFGNNHQYLYLKNFSKNKNSITIVLYCNLIIKNNSLLKENWKLLQDNIDNKKNYYEMIKEKIKINHPPNKKIIDREKNSQKYLKKIKKNNIEKSENFVIDINSSKIYRRRNIKIIQKD